MGDRDSVRLRVRLPNRIGAPMAAKPSISDATVQRIRDSIAAGRGRSMFDPADGNTADLDRFHGAQCRCGVPRKPPGLAKHVEDDGLCVVHPDKPPQPWVRGAGRDQVAGSAETLAVGPGQGAGSPACTDVPLSGDGPNGAVA